MNDTTNATGATSAHPGPERPPLRRPREGRVLAGVAAGIADHIGIDVAIVRLLVVVGTFLTGGFGLVVYLVAILVIPAADDQEERQIRAARASRASNGGSGRHDSGFWLGVGLLVIGVLWLFGGVLAPMNVMFFRHELIWPLVLIGFGLALWRASDRRGAPTAGTPQPTHLRTDHGPPGPAPHRPEHGQPSYPPAPGAVPPAGAGPTAPAAPSANTPGDAGAPTGPSSDATPVTPTPYPPPTAPPPSAGSAAETQEMEDSMITQETVRFQAPTPEAREQLGTGAGWGSSYGTPPYDPAGAPPPPPTATGRPDGDGDGWIPPEPPKGSLLTRITLGAILVTVGVLWMLRMADVITIGTSRIIAAALLVAGLGLVVGAWFGRGRWLILVGGLLLPLVVLAELLRPYGVVDMPGSTIRGGFGEIAVAPADLSELEARYQLAAGSIRLDLRDIAFDEATDLVVGVGAGEVVILLPEDVTADVTARVGVGERRIDDRSSSGFGVPTRRQQIETGDGSELLTLDVSAGFGEVRIDVLDPSSTSELAPID